MKKVRTWTVLGLGAAGLVAGLLSQGVRGQQEGGLPLPLPPLAGQPLPPAPPGGELKAVLPMPRDAAPLAPSLPGLPASRNAAPEPGSIVKTSAMIPVGIGAEQPGNALQGDVRPGKQQPAISVEWVGPVNVRVNQPMKCQIVVHNTSVVPVHNVIVRHRPNHGFVFQSSEPRALDGEELTWPLGTLAPNQTKRIQLQLLAQERGTLNCQASATFTAVAAHIVQVREPKLAVKTRVVERVIAGENVALAIDVVNSGDGVAEKIRAKVHLPDGLEHPYGKTLDFDVGNLGPKETKTMQVVCATKLGGLQKCLITLTGEGNLTCNDSAQVEVLVPRLDVVLAGPKLRYLDRHATYILKVNNPGSAPASRVEVNELIPAGFKFQKANHGGTYNEGTRQVSWIVGDLPPGQGREFAIDVIPVEPGEHRFVGQVRGAHGMKADCEARTVVEGLSSLFMEVAHIDDPIEVGAETAYEIRIANTGTKTETNVQVICALPEQLEFKGAKCSTALRYRHEGSELVFEPLPRLAPKADVIFRVQVKGIAPGDVRFRTRVKADGLKEPVMREESTRIYRDDSPLRSNSFDSPSSKKADPVPLPSVPAPSAGLPSVQAPGTPNISLPMPSGSAPPSVPLPPLPTPRGN